MFIALTNVSGAVAVTMSRRLFVALGWSWLGVTPGSAQKLKIDVPLPELESRAERDSNDAVAHYNLALGYWSQKRWEDADSSLKRARSLDPRFAPAVLAVAYLPYASGAGGRVELRSGGPGITIRWIIPTADSIRERFERNYRLAFMLDPLVDIRIAVTAEARGGYVDSYDRALYAYNDSKWQEAYDRFSKVIADSAATRGWYRRLLDDALQYHALAATRLSKHDDAMRDMQRLVDRARAREESDTMYRSPLRTNEYLYLLAFVKQRAGDWQSAVETYREALAADLGLFPAHARIADIYEGARQWDGAVMSRRNAINTNPDDASLQIDLGWTLAKAGRFEEAEAELLEAGERVPRDARAPYYLGLVQERLNKRAEARTNFERFVQIAPSRFERQIADAKQRLANLR